MIWTRVRARRFENSSAYTDGTSRSSAPQTMSVGAETRWIRFFNPLSGIVGTARRRDRRTRAPDVGNALDEQVHLAGPSICSDRPVINSAGAIRGSRDTGARSTPPPGRIVSTSGLVDNKRPQRLQYSEALKRS